MRIRLKRKYLAGFRGTLKSSSNRSGNKGRKKLNQKQKSLLPPQPKMQMRVFPGGKARMEVIA